MMTTCLHRHRILPVFFALTFLEIASGTVMADEFEMWVQRWGILDGKRLCDYDPESGHLLTSHLDGAILWDVKAGLALRRYLPWADSFSVTSGACILGEQILLGGTHRISLLDKHSGRHIRSFDLEEGWLSTIAVDGRSALLAASTSQGKLYLWDLHSGRKLQSIDAQLIFKAMAFSPDSRLLLCGSDEHIASIWNVETGELKGRVNSPANILHVAFSDDGRRMLTAGFGNIFYAPRLIVWDVDTLVPQQIIPRSARDASFVGKNVRVVLFPGEVELWPPDRHEDPPPPAKWPSNDLVKFGFAGVTRNHWLLRSLRDHSQISLIGPTASESVTKVHVEAPRFTIDDHFPLRFSQDGRFLLTGGTTHGNRPNRSALWNLHDGKVQFELENEDLGAFHPDGKRVVLARGRKLVVLHIKTGETLKSLEVNDEKYSGGEWTSLRFTQDGKRLLAAFGDWYAGNAGAIFLWEFESGKLLRNYASDTKAVLFAEMTRDEKSILAARSPGDDGSSGVDQLSVFDTATGDLKITRMFKRSRFYVGPASVEAGLVVARSDKITHGDDAGYEGENSLLGLSDISPKSQIPESSRASAFSPDGQILACFESEQRIGFRTRNGGLLHAYQTQLCSLRPVLFHPGQKLICGALFHPWRAQESRGIGVGLEDVLSGRLEAELVLFREPGSWLITTRDGSVNGSVKSLSRITWRQPDSIHVIRDSARTQRSVNPQRVAAVCSQTLPQGRSLRDQLRELPKPVIPGAEMHEPARNPWFKNYTELGQQAVKSFREAGANVQTNFHGQIQSLELKPAHVTAELLKQLRWSFALDRLDLTATGIHDAEIEPIGLLPSLKQLSLAGNPITDRGLMQLAALWQLEVLDVHATAVTAAGLNTLRFLPNLKTVIVPDSIKIDDLAPLRERHRNLEIVRKSGDR
jgi:WD40 repeat protein